MECVIIWCMLGKTFSRRHSVFLLLFFFVFVFFFFFFQEIDFDISCKLSPKVTRWRIEVTDQSTSHLHQPKGDNLHEMPKPIYRTNKKTINNLLSAEFVHRVVKKNSFTMLKTVLVSLNHYIYTYIYIYMKIVLVSLNHYINIYIYPVFFPFLVSIGENLNEMSNPIVWKYFKILYVEVFIQHVKINGFIFMWIFAKSPRNFAKSPRNQ